MRTLSSTGTAHSCAENADPQCWGWPRKLQYGPGRERRIKAPIHLFTRQQDAKSSDLFDNLMKGNSVPSVNWILLLFYRTSFKCLDVVPMKSTVAFLQKQKAASSLCDWKDNMTQMALLWQQLPGTVTLQRCPLQTSPQSSAVLRLSSREKLQGQIPWLLPCNPLSRRMVFQREEPLHRECTPT